MTCFRSGRSGLIALAVLAGLAVSVVPGHATAFCEVRQTSDGFVALREAPSASGKRLWRLKPGEMVQIDTTRPKKKGWAAVIYRSEDQKIQHTGWVSDRLIEKECG
jgi:hypothetical protein